MIDLLQVQPELPLSPLASLGVGGALALLMFWFYRHDRTTSEERFKSYCEQMDRRYYELAKDFRQIVQENTAASVRLADVIDRMLEVARSDGDAR